jgi:putative oxidoreductase
LSVRALAERLRPLAPLSLRLAVGAILCVYGGRLVFKEMGAFQSAVSGWHLPRWFGYMAAWSALLGGALLAVGLLTRFAAFLCIVFTTFILIKTKLHAGWQGGLDLPLLVLGALVSLLLSGGGRLSLDERLFKRASAPP